MLTRDGPVVVDQRLDGIGQLDDFGVTVDLDVRPVEFVRQHGDTGLRRSPDVGRLGALWITGDHDASRVVDAAGHRRALQRAVGPKCGEHHVMSRTNELK
jgi:hypothetical protein